MAKLPPKWQGGALPEGSVQANAPTGPSPVAPPEGTDTPGMGAAGRARERTLQAIDSMPATELADRPDLNTMAGDNLTGQGVDRISGASDALREFSPGAQESALANANAYAPTAQQGALAGLQGFATGPEAASAAQLAQQSAADQASRDALSLARGARGGPGAVAAAQRAAQTQIAGAGVENARNLGMLRAGEEQQQRANQLAALQASGQVAAGIDQGALAGLAQGAALSQGIDQSNLGAIQAAGGLDQALMGAGVQVRGQGIQAYGTDAQMRGQDAQIMAGDTSALAGLKEAGIRGEYGIGQAGAGPEQSSLIGDTVGLLKFWEKDSPWRS